MAVRFEVEGTLRPSRRFDVEAVEISGTGDELRSLAADMQYAAEHGERMVGIYHGEGVSPVRLLRTD